MRMLSMLRRSLALALALFCAARPSLAILPSSDMRVAVSSASITELDCKRRPFQMELTRSIGQSYKYMALGTFSHDPDPRAILMGVFAMIVMVPMAVLAVPADLFAAPFRRQCSFDLRMEADLEGWGGRESNAVPVALDARNLLSPGIEGFIAPQYFTAASSASADSQGRFSISIPGKVGRSKYLELGWLINNQTGNLLRLSKSGDEFLLSEEESDIGPLFEPPPPLVIHPAAKH